MHILLDSEPPIETKGDLVSWLESGQKPKKAWRIGTEHEKFGFKLNTLHPITYDGSCGIRKLFENFSYKFHWSKLYEGENLIALRNSDGQTITLEPGGQIELSGAALENLHQTSHELKCHFQQLNSVGRELGLGFLFFGFQPKSALAEIPRIPKQRYKVMESYMPTVGTRGLDMMFRTATVQVNLDFSSEMDMIKKFRVALALQPVATALFANSPFIDGKPSGYLSTRAAAWASTDPARTGSPEFIFEDGMSFERYVDWALDVPMYFVLRGDNYIDSKGQSFRDFLDGKLIALPDTKPNLSDWEIHLSTLFPEVRMKHFLEMRGADVISGKNICSLPAFWTGLLYDQTSLDSAWDLVKGWSEEDRAQLAYDVPKLALSAPSPNTGLGPKVSSLAKRVVELAEAGLLNRNNLDNNNDETSYLEFLHTTLDSNCTSAEIALNSFNQRWNCSVDPVFEEFIS